MKYNIFKRSILTGVIAIVLITFSCNDDFVIISPEYSIDAENYFNSEEDYYNGLVGAYDLLQTTYVNAILGEIASNNTLCGGEDANDVIGWQQVDLMTQKIVLWVGIAIIVLMGALWQFISDKPLWPREPDFFQWRCEYCLEPLPL